MSSQNPRALTVSMVNVGLALGTTSTYTTTASTVCFVNGVIAVVLTAQTNTATPTTDAATGAAFKKLTDNQATVIVFGLTVGGAIAMAQGSIVPTEVGVTTTKGAFIDAPQFPTLPDNFCPLGYALVRTAPSAADWTPGTSDWTATGIYAGLNGTTTCTQLNGTMPERPQIA